MTEYDYSPEAYDRYLATQNRIANWVDKTEQHRAEFQSANTGSPDLMRSGPTLYSKNSPLPRRHSGHSRPKQLVIPPSSPESDSSSDSYYEAPWPAQMHRTSPGMVLPQMQQISSPPPMMAPVFVTSPHKTSHHHHHHRSHDHRRSRSHPSPAYYNMASPPQSPSYRYATNPGGTQGYPMMPQYGGTQMPVMPSSSKPPRSAPASATTLSAPLAQPPYFQVQPSSAFLASNPPGSPQPGWTTYGARSPGFSRMSTPAGSPLRSPPYPRIPTYQSFAVQQPAQPPYIIPRAHRRV